MKPSGINGAASCVLIAASNAGKGLRGQAWEPRLAIFLLGALLMLPASVALAHNQDFIAAALRPRPDGIELWLAVDTFGQAHLDDLAKARSALAESLLVQIAGQAPRPLAEAGDLSFEDTPDWTQCLPASLQDQNDAQAHGFVTARWRRRGTESLRLTVPKGRVLDVLLWRQSNDAAAESQLLLAGESSPDLQPQPAGLGQAPPWTTGLWIAVVLLAAAADRLRRQRAKAQSINSA